MTIDTINRSLNQRFAAELPDCYERRIIFWFDSEREFEGMLDELDIPGVKLLKLTRRPIFLRRRCSCAKRIPGAIIWCMIP